MQFKALTSVLALLAAALALPPSGRAAALPNGGWDAAWSPDGKRLAFTSSSPHAIPNLWVVGADGSGLRQMTSAGAHEPRWLTDGKTVVFGTIRTGKATYMSVDADGDPGSEKPVEALPAAAEDPVWSPDGALVAYGLVPKAGGARDIWYARTGGGSATGLTAKFWCREWTWSPDGNSITYIVGRATGTSIWTSELSTRNMRLLYKGYCSALSYSPDGKRLAFAVPDVRSGFSPVVLDLATRKETRIEVRSFDGARLTWSPDGRRLFFCSSRKSEPAIWAVGADGTGLVRLTREGTPTFSPALSPDGTRFACQTAGKRAFGQEIHILDSSGKDLANLTPNTSPSYWQPVWSPDGSDFALQSDVNHSVQLFIGTPRGRLSKPYAPINGADPAEVAWLPGGRSMLLSDAGKVLVIDRSGRNPATPLPKLTTVVQGARVHGDEIVATEWGIRDAILTVHKLDGSSKRALTQWPSPEPATPAPAAAGAPVHPAPAEHPAVGAQSVSGAGAVSPARSEAGARSNQAVAQPAAYTGGAIFTLASATTEPTAQGASEPTGDPHANLGLIGPQENVGSANRPAVIDLSPAVSPDGKSVAFVRNGQIWLVGMSGGGEQQITSLPPDGDAPRSIADPGWSPDGKTIVFAAIASAPGGTALELWTCGTTPGSEQLLHSETTGSEYGLYYSECTNGPAFMPDGKTVLFTSITGDAPHVATVSLDGKDLREVVPAPSSFPAMDAAGAQLAYVDLSANHERVRVRTMASGATTGPLFRK